MQFLQKIGYLILLNLPIGTLLSYAHYYSPKPIGLSYIFGKYELGGFADNQLNQGLECFFGYFVQKQASIQEWEFIHPKFPVKLVKD